MVLSQLPNYLRSNRKRLSLSQEDVAFLLGKPATNLPRYEQFYRMPDLETALACEVIFQRSASEIFGGLYQKAEKEVIERARELAEKTNVPAKRATLMKIANKMLN